MSTSSNLNASSTSSSTLSTSVDSKDELVSRASKFLRSMKCLLARENKFTVTPKKGGGAAAVAKWKPTGGGGSVGGVVAEAGGGRGSKQQAGPQLLSQ